MKRAIREQLTQAIQRYLDRRQLKYKVDSDGDFHLLVGFAEVPIQARMLILREGQQGEILSVVVRFEGGYTFSEEEAARKANEWNVLRRWPRIYWRDGHFYGDFHLDCEAGISQRLIELMLHRVLLGSLQFILYLKEHQAEKSRQADSRGVTVPSLSSDWGEELAEQAIAQLFKMLGDKDPLIHH
ncbi:MAG: YbjN domain-containing protein [Bacteroidetes bacterium]|nr:MAG: YbjN domain-containing protein [Bacteroidota bacterium]